MSDDVRDYTIAAGATQRINRAGRYITIRETSRDQKVTVTARGEGGAQMLHAAGVKQGSNFGPYADEFQRVEVTNDGAESMVVSIGVSRAPVDYDPPPNVQVNDQNSPRQRTLDEKGFLAIFEINAAASNYSHTQLKNPTGSGKNIIVTRVWVSSVTGAGRFQLRAHDSDLTSHQADSLNRLLGGAAPVCQERQENNGSLYGAVLADWLVEAANTTLDLNLESGPIVIPPGKGLVGVFEAQNHQINAVYSYYEEDE